MTKLSFRHCRFAAKGKPFRLHFGIFWTFFKIGLFTFGGGLEMLPLFKRELVQRHKWIDQATLMDVISISQSIPGSLTVNSAAFLGRTIAGLTGAAVAILGAVLAPLLCIALVVAIQPWLQGNAYADRFFAGIRAAIVGLILCAILDLRKNVVRSAADVIIMVFAFVAIAALNIHFVYIIAAGVLCTLLELALACGTRIAVAIVLALEAALAACNFRTSYAFVALYLLTYLVHRYESAKKRKASSQKVPCSEQDLTDARAREEELRCEEQRQLGEHLN